MARVGFRVRVRVVVVVVVGAAYNHMNQLNCNYNIYNVTMITCQGNDTFNCQSAIFINTVVLAASSSSETDWPGGIGLGHLGGQFLSQDLLDAEVLGNEDGRTRRVE